MSESVAKTRKGGYEATNVNSLIPRYVISPELRDSATGLIKFLEEYYSHLHEAGNALYELDRLEKQFDIDETDDKYLTAIQGEIASIIPEVSGIEKKVLYKRIVQFYRAKGTKDAVASFFRVFFPDNTAPDYPQLNYRYDLAGNIVPHEYEIVHAGTLPSEWVALYKALSHPAGMKMIAILELLAQNSTHAIERGIEDLDSEYDGDLSDPDAVNFIRYDSHVVILDFVKKYLAIAEYSRDSDHAMEYSLILTASSTEDNILNEKFKFSGKKGGDFLLSGRGGEFFQEYGIGKRFGNIPHEPYSSRQRSHSVRKAYNSTLKWKDSTPISVYKDLGISHIDGFGRGMHELVDDYLIGTNSIKHEMQQINVGTDIVRTISNQYVPFRLGLDSDSDVYNIAFTDSDSFSDYNIPTTRLGKLAGNASTVTLEINVDGAFPDVKRTRGYRVDVDEITDVEDIVSSPNQENFEVLFDWEPSNPTISSPKTFTDVNDYAKIIFDLALDATWGQYVDTVNEGLLQTNIENWHLKVNGQILNNPAYRSSLGNRVIYRFAWLNPRFFKEGSVSIPTDRYCNLRTADKVVFGGPGVGDGNTYARNPILGSSAFFSAGATDKSFKMVLIDKDGTEEIGWPNISRDDTLQVFPVDIKVNYIYTDTEGNVIDRYFGSSKTEVYDVSGGESPKVKKITAAYGTEVMDLISHTSKKNINKVDTDYQTRHRAKTQIAKELVLFDDSDSVTKQYLQEDDGIEALAVDPLGEAKTTSTVFTPGQRNKIIWGAHTMHGNNPVNAQAGSYMDMPWQDMANYLGFKVEFDANAHKPGFDFELHFAGVWGEYWHKDPDAPEKDASRMWVNHVPGEPEYVDDTGPNLQNYNHTPIANNHHTDCWPFSYKMRERGVAPKEGLDGANYKMVTRGDGGMDLFIVGKIHQFWRDGAHPHLMMPGLSINSKDQAHEVWKFKNYNPRQLSLTLDSPDARLYSGGASPRLGILRETPISNDKIGAEYGTLSSLAKCDARTKDRSGTYHERKTDTKYGQNLTQVFHDLDLYGYTVGALNYPHTQGRILELPRVSPWTTDKPWSGYSIADKVLPGRGIAINSTLLDTDNSYKGDVETGWDGNMHNYFLSRVGVYGKVIGNPNNNSLPASVSTIDDRIRVTALILGMTKLDGQNAEFKWNTSNISYGWSEQEKENPYDLELFKNPSAGPFDYFSTTGGRIQEDKNVSRKRTLESGDGIPLSEWYRQYKVTPAHFHVSRIANVDQKAGRDTNTTGEEKFYLNITAFTDALRDESPYAWAIKAVKISNHVTRARYNTARGAYYAVTKHNYAVVQALKHIITGEALYGIMNDGSSIGFLTKNLNFTKSQANTEILKLIEDNPRASGGELNSEQQNRMFVEVKYARTATYGSSRSGGKVTRFINGYTNSVFDTSVGTFIQRKVNNLEQDSNGFILENDPDDNILSSVDVARDTFFAIGSQLQEFEVNNDRSLTNTADCTHANLYCRWHLKYKNETGEEGIFFQIPWNMTKSNTSFSNYLLQIENETYDGTTVTQTADPNNPKTIDDARNYFSEFVSNRQVVPGGTPDNIPASKLVRDMFRLKGENIKDAGKFPDGNGGFLAADNKTLGYYYPSSKAALVHLNKEDATNLNHRTDRDVAVKTTADGNATDDIFAEDGSRMPRMTATAPDAGDIDKQPETISFVDYAPINNYEETLSKFEQKIYVHSNVISQTVDIIGYVYSEWYGMNADGTDRSGKAPNGEGSPKIGDVIYPTSSNGYVMTVTATGGVTDGLLVIRDKRPGLVNPDINPHVVVGLKFSAGEEKTYTFRTVLPTRIESSGVTYLDGFVKTDNRETYQPYFYDSVENRLPANPDILYIDRLWNTNYPNTTKKINSWAYIYQQPRPENGYIAVFTLHGPGGGEQYLDISFSISTLEGPHRVMHWKGNVDAHVSVVFRAITDDIVSFKDTITHGYNRPDGRGYGTGNTNNKINQLGAGKTGLLPYYQEIGLINGGSQQYGRTTSIGTLFNTNIVWPSNVKIGEKNQFMGTDADVAKAYGTEGKGWHGDLTATIEYTPFTTTDTISGYPAMVPSGIVPRNHNKLLGLPHILNQPNPQNLILPS